MIQKNDVLTLTADAHIADGVGIARAEGKTVFIEGLLPGETAEVRIISNKKTYASGKLLRLVSRSADRVEPFCPVYGRCGGCTCQHIRYETQLEFKRRTVAECFYKFAHLAIEPNPTVPSGCEKHYRNKVSLPVGMDRGELQIGCFARRSHRVVDVRECGISAPEFTAAAEAIRGFILKNNISIYDETTCEGLLRHIVLRRASTGELMAGLVINGSGLKKSEELVSALTAASPDIKSIVLNINREPGNAILGAETQPIYGSGRIRESILCRSFDISLNTFLQVNHSGTERMYAYILGLLGSEDVVADLYCGAGTITLCAAPQTKRIYGIEIVPQAIEDAKKNAVLNGIANAEFICADCADAFGGIIKAEGRLDAVIVDPPRKGLSPSVIDDIAESGAKKLIYVSCDPATLARDAALLIEKGFYPVSIQPFDMFPQTGHVESVVLLSKVQK